MLNLENRNQLQEAIVKIDPTKEYVGLYMSEAGLDIGHIDMRGPGIVVWNRVITHAVNKNRLKELLEAIKKDYPEIKEINEIITILETIEKQQETENSEPSATNSCKVLILFDRKDENHFEQLRLHLKTFKHSFNFEISTFDSILGGEDVEKRKSEILNESEIWLLLISPSFMGNDDFLAWINDAQYKSNTKIPVWLRRSNYEGVKGIDGVVGLPKNGSLLADANDIDGFYYEIANGVAELLKQKGYKKNK